MAIVAGHLGSMGSAAGRRLSLLGFPPMLILLPPSEGKSQPKSRRHFDVERLAHRELSDSRLQMANALVKLCAQPKRAATTLGLGPKQLQEIEDNAGIWVSPVAPAIDLFDGVLFQALDYASLTVSQRKRADDCLLIFNALTGVACANDLLPRFRLSADVTLPSVGNVGTFWAKHLSQAIKPEPGELVIDARSGVYTRFWKPSLKRDFDFVALKIVQRVGSGKSQKIVAVSHFNKASKGLLVRDMLTARQQVSTLGALTQRLEQRGWDFEYLPATGKGVGTLEVLIRDQ